MTARTGASRYSAVAIALHWLIALIIIANLIGGLTLDWFFDSADPAMKQLGYTIIGLHKSFGLTVIGLTLVRIGWRLGHPPPPLPERMPRLQRLAARGTHIGFYGLMLLLPFSGWAMASTSARVYPLRWFGVFDVPTLPLAKGLNGLFSESHEILGWIAIALIAVHVLAALKHHFIDADDVLTRMLPFGRKPAGEPRPAE